MEEVTKTVPKYKTIRNGEETVTEYKACDGKIFKSKKDAVEHEDLLKIAERWALVKQVKHDVDQLDVDTWSFMDSQETIDFYMARTVDIHHCDLNGYFISDKNVLQVGDWVGVTHEYNDCSYDIDHLYTLAHLKRQIDELVEKTTCLLTTPTSNA